LPFAPTLVRPGAGLALSRKHPELLDDPDVVRTIDPDVLQAVKKTRRAARSRTSVGREDFERAVRNTKRMAAAGVPIAVGSDGGSAIDFPGAMTPPRAGNCWWKPGCRPWRWLPRGHSQWKLLALRKQDELGVIEAGKRADLLLLKANPLEDRAKTSARSIN